MLVLILTLIFIYINIDLRLLGVASPYYLATLFGTLLVLKNYTSVLKGWKKWGLFLFIVTFWVFIPTFKYGFNSQIIISYVQTIPSIIIGYAVFIEVLNNRYRVEQWFKMIMFILLAGALLEVSFDFVKTISDSVRNIVYDYHLYEADKRDINLFGYIRPKFFSREPSFITKFASYLIIPIYCFANKRNNIFLLCLFYSAIFLLVTSSIKMIPVMVILILLHYHKTIINIRLKKVISFSLILILLTYLSLYFFGERLLSLIVGEDISGFIRINLPAILSGKVLASDPLLGWGFANKEIIEAYISGGLLEFTSYIRQNAEALSGLNNYFFGMIIYFGVIGSIGLVYGFRKLLYNLNRSEFIIALLTFFILGFTHGGWITISFWAYTFLLFASLKYYFSKQSYNFNNDDISSSYRIALLHVKSPIE